MLAVLRTGHKQNEESLDCIFPPPRLVSFKEQYPQDKTPSVISPLPDAFTPLSPLHSVIHPDLSPGCIKVSNLFRVHLKILKIW